MSKVSHFICHKDHPLDPAGYNGGAEMATIYLARFLKKQGCSVIVAAQLKGGEQTLDGVEYWDLGSAYDVAGAISRVSSRGEYYLISAGRAQALVESSRDSNCLARILITHDRAGHDTGLRAEIVSSLADYIVCVSNAQRDIMIRGGMDAAKTVVVHNGVELDLFQSGDPELRNPRKLVFAGALVEDKGIHYLIQSFAELKQKYMDLSLDVYGSAALWGRSEFLKPKDIEAQVPGIKFHGNVPPTQLAEAYKQAGLFIFPSIWFEPFGMTASDALATGCPVIAYDVGGPRDIVIDGETGVLLTQVTVDALTRAIDGLLGSPEKMRALSRNILSKHRERFDWQRAALCMRELCEQAAEKRYAGSVQGKIGVVTTWNQECGLATYAKFLLSDYHPGSYVVLAEEAAPTSPDETYVVRCWKRGSGDLSKLISAIKIHDIKLLHLNCHYRFFPEPQFAELLKKLRKEGVKVVLQLHNPYTIDPSLQALVVSVDLVLVHTPENRLEIVANGGSPEKVKVIEHGVAVRSAFNTAQRLAVRRKLAIPDGSKLVVCFGFIQPHKGMEGLVEGVAHLVRQGIDAYGLIAGSQMDEDPNSAAYVEALKNHAQKLGVSNRVLIPNCFMSETEVANALQASDVVLMNYRSQHYEASGACSLAIGAGCVVAASIAPPFQPFGDAVWHITSGYPVPLSLELLLMNDELRGLLLARAEEYRRKYAWPKIATRLHQMYGELGCRPLVIKEENVVEKNNISAGTNAGLKVLIQNRPNTYSQPGGDTVLIDKTVQGLQKLGVQVQVDVEGKANPADFDLVHLFNFALPDLTRKLAERAAACGVPYVVTTLNEDVAEFHNQSHIYAGVLAEYVRLGQDQSWWENNRPVFWKLDKARGFDNAWTAAHAAALLPNGSAETRTLKREYPQCRPLEVKLGFELGAMSGPEPFIREYGVRDFVLCVGRIETRKNQLMLLKALEDSDLTVVLAGGGFSYQPEYEKAVRSLRRRGKTIVLDRLSPEMLASAYAAAKIHALPSWYELPGLVTLEAAAQGRNVVATENGTLSDYLGNLAFYCDPWNPRSIYGAVMAAYHSPVDPRLIERARSYSWEQTARQTLEVYRQCARPRVESAVAPMDWSKVGFWAHEAHQMHTAPAASQTSAAPQPLDERETNALLDQGEEAVKRGDYQRAHEIFASGLCRSPEHSGLLRAQGALYLAESKVREAREFFSRSLRSNPRDAKTLCGVGMCDLYEGHREEAHVHFVRALEIDPNQLTAIHQLIQTSHALNRFDDLERVLRRYVADHAEDLEMRFCLAGCLYKSGKQGEAEETALAILRLSPQHRQAGELVELIRKQKAQAIAAAPVPPLKAQLAPQVQSVAENAPARPAVSSVLQELTCLEEQKRDGKYGEVEEGCSRMLARPGLTDADREQITLLRAEALTLQKGMGESESIFQQVLHQNPRSARAMCGLGAIAGHRNNWEEAERLFQQALSCDARCDVALAGLGLVYSRKREQPQAWDCYQRAINLNPENMRALLGLIETGYPMGRFTQIESAIRNYLEMHPASLDFLYSLAGCLFAQNKLAEAKAEVEKIMLFNPSHEKARELSEMIASKEGVIPVHCS